VGGLLGKIKEKVWKSSGTTNPSQAANTYAEAEQQTHAQEVQQTDPASETSRKLVVVGRESVFSQEIIDYSLEMAERMSYEIVALNAAPLHCDTFEVFSESFEKICEDFKALSKEKVKEFREAAKQKGIPFTHIIKFSDSYEVLKEIKHEIGEFEFVVSELEDSESASGAQDGNKAKRKIFVYSIM